MYTELHASLDIKFRGDCSILGIYAGGIRTCMTLRTELFNRSGFFIRFKFTVCSNNVFNVFEQSSNLNLHGEDINSSFPYKFSLIFSCSF